MDEVENTKGAWATVAEGGLPRLIAGPAGQAVSRLIGGVVDIPAAWLESVQQGIRDRTEAKSDMSKVLSEAAANLATSDPEIVQRAMTTLLSKQVRAQQNREAIAAAAVKDLLLDPPLPNSKGPSDDWLNVFERLAEDSSSENLQRLFADVLIGEIRRPGSISAMTLQMASYLNEELAKQVEIAASRIVPPGAVLCGDGFSGPDHVALSEIGFMTSPSIVPAWGDTTDESGRLQIAFPDSPFVVKYPDRRVVSLGARYLTQAGRELVSCLKLKPDIQFFSEVFRRDGAEVQVD